jgi:hypothetical protein
MMEERSLVYGHMDGARIWELSCCIFRRYFKIVLFFFAPRRLTWWVLHPLVLLLNMLLIYL